MANTPQPSATWAVTVLRRLGITPNNTNELALHLWSQSEGYNNPTASGTYNWLASNSPNGITPYPSYTAGVNATAAALKNPRYANVVKALAKATDQPTHTSPNLLISKPGLAMIWTAINVSGWCTGHAGRRSTCQNGKYPTALYSFMGHAEGSATTGVVPTGILAGGTTTAGTTTCIIRFPGVAGVGSFCIFSKSQGRAVKGALLVVAGGAVMAMGLVFLAAYGLGSSKAAQTAMQVRRAPATLGMSSTQRRARARRRTERQATRTLKEIGGEEGAQRSAAQNRDVARRAKAGTDLFTAADTTPGLEARNRERLTRPVPATRPRERRPRAHSRS